jgi:hypothetical protein
MSAKPLNRLVLIAALSLPLAVAADELPTWEGWIVGAPCAAGLRVADCPLRHVDDPVLLLENGEVHPFLYGDGSSIREEDLDKAYSKKVRLTGELADGLIQSVRMDLLEISGDRVFFKGCL